MEAFNCWGLPLTLRLGLEFSVYGLGFGCRASGFRA